MAVLDRLKTRVETDLDDTELGFIITQIQSDIAVRFGPDASAGAIHVEEEGLKEWIVVDRAIDTTQSIVVEEEWDAGPMGIMQVTLGVNDYRIWPDGFRIQRRQDGQGSNPRRVWGNRVNLTYTPIDDQVARDEVTIKIAILTIQYDSAASTTVGDFSMETKDFNEEKECLMKSLAPRRGMYMR